MSKPASGPSNAGKASGPGVCRGVGRRAGGGISPVDEVSSAARCDSGLRLFGVGLAKGDESSQSSVRRLPVLRPALGGVEVAGRGKERASVGCNVEQVSNARRDSQNSTQPVGGLVPALCWTLQRVGSSQV
jgi:hypothetical protein